MLRAYDCSGIKGERMKLNPFIKEAAGSGAAHFRTEGWGCGGVGVSEVSPGLITWHVRRDS